MDIELDRMKSDIDLRSYAAAQGYSLDAKQSWRGSAVMRHPNGDKIIIKRGSNGYYVYFSVRDGTDNGTIVDFVQKRMQMSLGAVRKELRPYLGMASSQPPVFAPLPKTTKDRLQVESAYAKMRDAGRHDWLENERALPFSLFTHERFKGRIRIDDRNNAIFPHFDGEGLCGYEIRNAGFKGFAAGGNKGLWLSNELPGDNRLVLCESAIDALSYAVLFPDTNTRYGSVGGKLNPFQADYIRIAAERMPEKSRIVAAMDADEDGAELAGIVRDAVARTGRNDLSYIFEEPFGYKDWNDQLRKIPKSPLPARKQAPSVA
jgi:hypothetical protein